VKKKGEPEVPWVKKKKSTEEPEMLRKNRGAGALDSVVRWKNRVSTEDTSRTPQRKGGGGTAPPCSDLVTETAHTTTEVGNTNVRIDALPPLKKKAQSSVCSDAPDHRERRERGEGHSDRTKKGEGKAGSIKIPAGKKDERPEIY